MIGRIDDPAALQQKVNTGYCLSHHLPPDEPRVPLPGADFPAAEPVTFVGTMDRLLAKSRAQRHPAARRQRMARPDRAAGDEQTQGWKAVGSALREHRPYRPG